MKRQRLDLPALYQPRGRYYYQYGVNWRAILALLCAIGSTLPGLANNVNSNVDIGSSIYLANINWYYGILVAASVYTISSVLLPARESLVPMFIDGVGVVSDAFDVESVSVKGSKAHESDARGEELSH